MKFAKNLKIRIDKIFGLDPEYFMCFDTSFMYGTCCYTQFYGKCTINLCMCYTIWFEWLEPKHRYLKYKWMLTCPQLFFGFRFWVIDAKQFLHFRVKMFWHSLQGGHMRTASWTIIASNDLFPTDLSEGLSIKWTAPAAHAKKNNVKEESKEREDK